MGSAGFRRGAGIPETDAHGDKVDQLRSELPDLRNVLRISGSEPPALDVLAEAGKSVDAKELEARVAAIKSGDPATLIYTSGTTGRPKGCQLTHCNFMSETHGAKDAFPSLLGEHQRLLVFLPLAHVLSRAISVAAFENKVTVGFSSDIKNLVPMFAAFKPTLVVSVPRVFEKVYNTAEQNAQNDGKGRISRSPSTRRSTSARRRIRRRRVWCCAPSTRCSTGWCTASCGPRSVATVAQRCPVARRWGRGLGHFYRGVGLTIYEGYGLTETSAAITVNRIDGHEDRVGRKVVAGQQHARRGRQRVVGQG